jgi:hypothetical protein
MSSRQRHLNGNLIHSGVYASARTLSSHNPTTDNVRLIGQYEISGTSLPAKGFF